MSRVYSTVCLVCWRALKLCERVSSQETEPMEKLREVAYEVTCHRVGTFRFLRWQDEG